MKSNKELDDLHVQEMFGTKASQLFMDTAELHMKNAKNKQEAYVWEYAKHLMDVIENDRQNVKQYELPEEADWFDVHDKLQAIMVVRAMILKSKSTLHTDIILTKLDDLLVSLI